MLICNRSALASAIAALIWAITVGVVYGEANKAADAEFFERRIRPVLIQHCYECHSEEAGEQQGGLLLDRQSGWIEGGDTNKAIIPGEPEASLLISAIRYDNDALQMPPDGKLDDETIKLLETWVQRGAGGPAEDMGETEFSRLGDQPFLFDQAKDHWAFQKVTSPTPPANENPRWNTNAIDRFVFAKLTSKHLTPSRLSLIHI